MSKPTASLCGILRIKIRCAGKRRGLWVVLRIRIPFGVGACDGDDANADESTV